MAKPKLKLLRKTTPHRSTKAGRIIDLSARAQQIAARVPPQPGTVSSTSGAGTDLSARAKAYGSTALTQSAGEVILGQHTTLSTLGGVWFSPGQPLKPVAQDAERQFDYPFAYNLPIQPRHGEQISFEQLQALADYDILRLIIETRKDQVSVFDWEVLTVDLEKGKTTSPADQAGIDEMTAFFRTPSLEPNINTWDNWIRAFLDDMFVIDANVISPRYNRRGDKPVSLDLVDGGTIKRLIDEFGRTPLAPDPAYQQVLHGLPAVDYSVWTPDNKDGIIYWMRNPRNRRVYGLSPVEQVVLTVNIAFRKTMFEMAYFTEGNIPEAFCGVPESWCYSADTEVLTRRGWLRFQDVDITVDEFATRSPARDFEWQKATGINLSHYSGNMISLKSRTIDCLVNPPHRVLVSTPKRDGTREEKVVLARDLLQNPTTRNRIPVASFWEDGIEVEDQVFVHEKTRGNPHNLQMTGDQFCAFMGMYLAEGSTSARTAHITQAKNGKGYWHYSGLLTSILGKEPAYSGSSFTLSNVPLVDYLKQFGTASEKFIPPEIMNAPVRQIELFLTSYFLGDGSATQLVVYTSSKKMADQLQELVQKFGYSATISAGDRRGRVVFAQGHNVVTNHINYVVNISRSDVRRFTVAEEEYDGKIGCVSVPNGILYVRRNSKPY